MYSLTTTVVKVPTTEVIAARDAAEKALKVQGLKVVGSTVIRVTSTTINVAVVTVSTK